MVKTVYISVGKLDEREPIMPYVLRHVEEGEEKRVAKALRYSIASNFESYGFHGIKEIAPGKLWWAVYDSYLGTEPLYSSENYLWRDAMIKEAEETAEKYRKEQQKALEDYQAGSYDQKTVQVLGVLCPVCGCYSIMNGYCTVCVEDDMMEISHRDWYNKYLTNL